MLLQIGKFFFLCLYFFRERSGLLLRVFHGKVKLVGSVTCFFQLGFVGGQLSGKFRNLRYKLFCFCAVLALRGSRIRIFLFELFQLRFLCLDDIGQRLIRFRLRLCSFGRFFLCFLHRRQRRPEFIRLCCRVFDRRILIQDSGFQLLGGFGIALLRCLRVGKLLCQLLCLFAVLAECSSGFLVLSGQVGNDTFAFCERAFVAGKLVFHRLKLCLFRLDNFRLRFNFPAQTVGGFFAFLHTGGSVHHFSTVLLDLPVCFGNVLFQVADIDPEFCGYILRHCITSLSIPVIVLRRNIQCISTHKRSVRRTNAVVVFCHFQSAFVPYCPDI